MQISYFAWVRDRMGTGEEAVQVPATIANVRDLIEWLRVRDERGADAFADVARIRAAVDGTMAGVDTSILGAAEVALFPPVTGG